MKRFLAYFVVAMARGSVGLFGSFVDSVFSGSYAASAVGFILFLIMAVVLPLLSFWLSERIKPSVTGLRYLIPAIFSLFIGLGVSLDMLERCFEGVKFYNFFINPFLFGSLLFSLLNLDFIFGFLSALTYKKSFKKLKRKASSLNYEL